MTAHDLNGLLGTDWDGVEVRADEFLEQGRSQVVRWRWAPLAAWLDQPAPLWRERDGEASALPLREARPKDVAQAISYGFDDSDRLIFSGLVDPSGETRDATTWVRRVDGGAAQLYFSRSVGALRLGRVSIPEYRGDRLVRLRMLYDARAGAGEAIESYEYDEASGAVSRIAVEHRRPGSPDERYVYDVVRDGGGDVALIRFRDGTDTTVVYRRRDTREIRAARRRVEQEMVELTARWVRRLLVERHVWAIALVYGVDEPGLPPALAATHGEAGPEEESFYPAEWEVFDPDPSEFRDPAFREDCRILTQEWRFIENEAEPRKTLVRIAKRFTEKVCPSILDQDQAPVVYAVDEELADLRRNLRSAGIQLR